jgi:hypothetical protein
MADQGSMETSHEHHGKRWIWGGLAAILVANAIALFIPTEMDSRNPAKADTVAPRGPAGVVALAARHRDHGRTQLFATDRDGRLWTCQIGGSLLCRWQLVLIAKQ